jgi:hypothetical protein
MCWYSGATAVDQSARLALRRRSNPRAEARELRYSGAMAIRALRPEPPALRGQDDPHADTPDARSGRLRWRRSTSTWISVAPECRTLLSQCADCHGTGVPKLPCLSAWIAVAECRRFLSQCADRLGAGLPGCRSCLSARIVLGPVRLRFSSDCTEASCRWKFVNSSLIVGCGFRPLTRRLVCVVVLLSSPSGRRISILERCCEGFGRGDLIWFSVMRCLVRFRPLEVVRP